MEIRAYNILSAGKVQLFDRSVSKGTRSFNLINYSGETNCSGGFYLRCHSYVWKPPSGRQPGKGTTSVSAIFAFAFPSSRNDGGVTENENAYGQRIAYGRGWATKAAPGHMQPISRRPDWLSIPCWAATRDWWCQAWRRAWWCLDSSHAGRRH